MSSVGQLTQKTSVNENTSSSIVNVCFLIDNLSVAGTEKHLLGLIKDLDRSKVNPILVLLDGENEQSKNLEPSDCEVHRLGLKSFFRPSLMTKSIRFIRMLRQKQIDVLQMYFPDSTLFGSICGKFAGVRNLIRTRRNAGYWMTTAHRIRARLITALVTKTIVNNDASKESVIEQERAPDKSVEVIPNGVNLAKYQFAQNRLRNHSPIRIGMIGNLREVKRVGDLIEATTGLTAAGIEHHIEIAGDGPLRDELQQKIEHLGVGQKVTLLGTVDDIPSFLNSLDLLVSCSESEGLSNTILEAMATGIPVVATDIDGNRQLIKDEVNGLLFPVGQIENLVSLIKKVCSDSKLADTLSVNGRKTVEEGYEQSQTVKKYEAIYLSCDQRK